MATRRSQLILVALLALALVGVAFLAVPGSPIHKQVKQGLDLQGGLEVVLKAEPPKNTKLTLADLDRSVEIMRNRVDKLGVSEPEIRKQGSDQIVIELAGVHDANSAAALIGKTAALELYDLETSLVPPSISVTGVPVPKPKLYDLLTLVKASAAKGTPEQWYLFGTKKKLLAGPKPTKAALLATNRAKANPKATILAVPAKTTVITCSAASAVICPPGISPVGTSYYLFKHDLTNPDGPPQMTGKDLKLSGTRADFDTTTSEPEVLMQFTKHGNKRFHEITKDEAVRGQIKGSAQHFAIVLDNEIRSFPQIDYQQYPTGIDPTGGGARITGIRSVGESKNLALVLQTGALPVKFKTIERTDVSATLGKDSLKQAKDAALVGLLLVAVFLLLLYRFLGLVAVIGLAIYAAFLYAAILILGVTLTLPGFAGLILTIGVAADANVVVFERIKEESRAGKSVRAAIAAGYAKGFRTILDANVVTAITAMVLFAVATAGVKGFALMLLIGTVISLVTAVAATRAMLGLLAGFKWFDNPRFMGAAGEQGLKFLQIDYMRRRYLWFAISGVIVVVGALSLGFNGLNLGIDFKGGTQVTFRTAQPVSLTKVRRQAADVGHSDAVVQGRGQVTGQESYKSFQMRLKSLSPAEQTKLSADLSNNVGAVAPGTKNVSSSFGRQIAKAAIIAIVFSMFLIVLYIALRFDLKYAVPVIVAMLHDVVITVGIYSLTGREVSASTVAAVLTVLGYSIYDTIIIFDRIRENVPIMRHASFATIANISLWETIRRSLATTFITLLPVGALLFFGGATLKDFAFALLVGITSGAYSSIFIAAPLVTVWKETEPEFARRRDVPMDGREGDRVLARAERAASAEPSPDLNPIDAVEGAVTRSQEKRERRKQRRRSRPHGRAR